MAKFALPIRSTYVPDWGPWEAIRELVQNAKDEEDANGSEMTIRHHGKLLTISNRGADMSRSVLLLGQTTKADRGDLRGQFGEGLNLALLAAERAGMSIVIYTQTERWHVKLEPCPEYGNEECLVVQTRKLSKRRDGVEVVVSMEHEDWVEIEKLLLFLNRIPDNRIVRTSIGAILLEPDRKGHIYVKGIFTAKLDKLNFGYDLDVCKLDRDRRMVDVWDLQWTLSRIYAEALSKRPELLQPAVYRMLRDGAEDTQQFSYHADVEVAEGLLDHFYMEHGENAVPVASISESKEMDSVGKKGVVVAETLRAILQKKTGTPSEIQYDMLEAITETHAWGDLEDTERALLTWAASAVDGISGDLRGPLGPLMSRLEIVTFQQDNLCGVCDLTGSTIRIARDQLANHEDVLSTLVHEEAHAISAAGDCDHEHTAAVSELWKRLYFARPASS